jgi:hypothetical protein
MPLATASAIAEIATVLFAAPLVLGAYVVLQGAGWRVSALYLGLLSALLLVALIAGVIGLVLISR